ncbi:MAG: hypothetical protein J6S27_04460 [Thermoguttaceae bacterium]|nr:hypothetical protein [Thermoguttaceae bacterium]
MENRPEDFSEEEFAAEEAACASFDVKPYVDRLVKICSGSWEKNDIGSAAVDMVKAWMAVDCPHDENYYGQLILFARLITRLIDGLEERIGTQALIEIQSSIFPDCRISDFDRDLHMFMSCYCFPWLESYRPCYRESQNYSLQERERFLENLPLSDEEKQRNRHAIELEKNCPYDPARIDEQKFTDMLILDSLGSANNDPEEVAREVGLLLGKTVFEAYPECRNEEEYCCVIARVCDGVRRNLMREFADSNLIRHDRFAPMDLYRELRHWTEIGVKELCDRGR